MYAHAGHSRHPTQQQSAFVSSSPAQQLDNKFLWAFKINKETFWICCDMNGCVRLLAAVSRAALRVTLGLKPETSRDTPALGPCSSPVVFIEAQLSLQLSS